MNHRTAPTNAAFDALPKGTLDNLLLPENIGTLTDVLKYHVVAANALSSSLSCGDIETLNGDSVEVVVSDAGVMVNDANVVIPDIIASNGIIHVIDSVLIPPADEPSQRESKRKRKHWRKRKRQSKSESKRKRKHWRKHIISK